MVVTLPAETQRKRRGHRFYPPQDVLRKIPAVGQTEGQGDSAIVYLHYFVGGSDWYVLELDTEDARAFGWAEIVPGGGEYGYTSLPELETVKVHGWLVVERDLFWEPKPIGEVLASRR